MRRFVFTPLLIISALSVHGSSLHAQQVARPELQTLAVPAAKAKTIATRLSLQYRDVPGVQISPDVRNQQLVVMAPEATQKLIAKEVQSILASHTRGGAAGSSRGLSFRLKHLTWGQFEDDLQRLAGGPLPITTSRNGERAAFRLTAHPLQGTTVEVDRRNNSVTVIAPGASIPGWEKMIAVLDKVPAKSNHVTQLLRLENAEPAPIQRALRLLKELESTGGQSVAAAPVGAFSPFRNAVFQQDAAGRDAQGQAAPEEGADEAALGPDDEAGAGVIGDTQIQFVPELGTIIIRGAKRDVERVMEVIKQIEEQSKITKPDVEVVELKHADANAVATLLQQLYEDVLSARQGEVSITSLDSPNALLLIGRTEAISGLRELIEKIDQPVAESSRLRVFRLQNASALDAEQTIRDFFTDRPGAGDDLRPGLGPRVRVLADYRTNSLIVSASSRDMIEVTRLINDLDVQEISAQSQIKIFPLNNAIAEDLAPVLQSAISGEPEDGVNENITLPSTTLSIVSVDSNNAQVLNSGILADAVVTADTGANAIVVRAPAASMPLIAELIRQLDRAPGIDSLVKVFTIKNGDALQLTTALQSLFGEDAATFGTSVGAANLPPSTAAADSSLVPLRFTTDQRTNSIVVSGSADDLDVVESILIRLDSEGFAERITEVIWLRHQAAADVTTAIQQYVQQRIQTVNTIQQFQQGLGPYDLPDRDLIVVPEPVSNSVLLSVSPRIYPEVRNLIDKLDRRPPMVLIKVMLAEVRLDDEFEIGGEVGLQDSLLYDRNIAASSFPGATEPSNPGFNFNGNGLGPTFDQTTGLPIGNSFGQGTVAPRGVTSFGLGATNSTLGYGGLVLSAASDSLSLLFRTLQDAQRFQVLSRPQVMAMDNTEGFVQVGRLIARVTDVINNGISGTQVVTEDIEVGLILQVRPRVGADGLIIMEVDITRSERDDDAGTPVPTGALGEVVIINDILRTTAQSVVAAYSGQTVVFGGLIQKTRINASRRVPLVSDIPLLGHMFKFDAEVEQRRETLAFLTPMIVTGEEDLDYVKETETRRMSWCLAEVVEAHGDVGVSGGNGLWGPAAGTTIYPDLQPTVDSSSVLIEDSQPYEVPGSEVIISDEPVTDPSQAGGTSPPPSASSDAVPSPSDAQPPAGPLEFSTPTPDLVPKTFSEGALPPPKSVPQDLPPPVVIPPQSRFIPGDSGGATVSQTGFSSSAPLPRRQVNWIDVVTSAEAQPPSAASGASTWKSPEKPKRLPQP